MLYVGFVARLHNCFCMYKIKAYIMHIPSTAGWSLLRSVSYIRAISKAAKLPADSVSGGSPQNCKNHSYVCVLASK